MSEFVTLGDTVRIQATVSHPISGFVVNADTTPRYYVFKNDSDTALLQGDMTLRTGFTGKYRGSFVASLANGFNSGDYVSVQVSGRVENIQGWGNIKEFVVEDIFNANIVQWSGQHKHFDNIAQSNWSSVVPVTSRTVTLGNNYHGGSGAYLQLGRFVVEANANNTSAVEFKGSGTGHGFYTQGGYGYQTAGSYHTSLSTSGFGVQKTATGAGEYIYGTTYGQLLEGGDTAQYLNGGSYGQQFISAIGQYIYGSDIAQKLEGINIGQQITGNSVGQNIYGVNTGQNIIGGEGQYIEGNTYGQRIVGISYGQYITCMTGIGQTIVGATGVNIEGSDIGEFITGPTYGQKIESLNIAQYINGNDKGQYILGANYGQHISSNDVAQFIEGYTVGQYIVASYDVSGIGSIIKNSANNSGVHIGGPDYDLSYFNLGKINEIIWNSDTIRWSGVNVQTHNGLPLIATADIYYANIKYLYKNEPGVAYNKYGVMWYKNGTPLNSGDISDPKISVYDLDSYNALINNQPMDYVSTAIGALKYISSSAQPSGTPYMVSVSGSIDGSYRKWNQIVGLDFLY